MILQGKNELEVGVIICYCNTSFHRWNPKVKSYKSSRARLERVEDFLKGEYGREVTVPILVIGIE